MDLQTLMDRFGSSGARAIDVGFSGAIVVRLERGGEVLYYKAGPDVAAEADRLAWLGTTDIPCPRIVDRGENESGEWMLTTELGGRDASQPWPAAERPAVLAAMADGIKRLHALSECPFDSPYPGSREAVTHGDYCAPNVFVDPATLRFSGLLDLSRLGFGNRYVDFALMHRSLAGTLNPQYGGLPAARDFVVRAGGDPDDPQLAHFVELGTSGLY
ncbi:phosphotransferase [Kribbella sp. CA-293567]|uniref:phosphotransferase n=1 Tax=Kribbella sp. CA-293567 TaxID=3002436 RepID=UPI0022DCFC09|nr:phosphotransferase [Kribbella sp. CA-293567]WBQ08096.1 phosphotransferase [Kribbella sp. CA-293567]